MGGLSIPSGERHRIPLDRNDIIAAAQVLSYIARPERPESGVKLLNEWWLARCRTGGDDISAAPFAVDKPNRLQVRLDTFGKDLRNGFQAGVWLQWKILGEAAHMHHWFAGFTGVSLGKLAAKKLGDGATSRDAEIPNVRRNIWIKRRPVAHIALAAANEIRAHHARPGTKVRLDEILFSPRWLSGAIVQAEEWAQTAQSRGIVCIGEPYLFERTGDKF